MRRIFRTRRLSDSSCVVARSCITLVRRYLSLRSCLRSCGQVLGTPGFVQFHRFLPPYKLCSLSATWFVSELSCQRIDCQRVGLSARGLSSNQSNKKATDKTRKNNCLNNLRHINHEISILLYNHQHTHSNKILFTLDHYIEYLYQH